MSESEKKYVGKSFQPVKRDEPKTHVKADPKPAAKAEPKPKAKRAAKKSPERKSAEAEDRHKGNPQRSAPEREPQSRDKALEEVRAIRDENIRRGGTHERTEIHREVEGMSASGSEKAKPMEIHAGGGVAYLNTHGEIRLDQDGVITLQKVLAEAFQAVS